MHILGSLAIAVLIFIVIRGMQEDYEARQWGRSLNSIIVKPEVKPEPRKDAPNFAALWVIIPLVLIALVDILESLQ